MKIKAKNILFSNPLFGYLLAFAIGYICGVANLRGPIVELPYIGLIALCLLFAFQNNLARVFSLLAYIVYIEIYIRAYGRALPYLTTQYFFILLIIILSFKKRGEWRIYSRSFIMMVLYCIMEILDMVRAEDINVTRGIAVQTVTLTMTVIWGAFNFLTPEIINKLFTHIKYASIFICGVMVTAHLSVVKYSLFSNYDVTNGLAPVQLSGYLGFACIIFFWSILNEKELNYKMLLNVVMMGVVSVYMLLSFSRGGFYFLSIIVLLYFLFNLSKVRSYLVLLMIIPIAISVYLYVSEETGGLIGKRYAEKGSSGRDVLVEIGFKLFEAEPLAGVGTGNFSHEVEARKLYYTESGAHNEFIRAAAEHGFLGIFFYWGFFALLFLEIFARQGVQREYAFYFALLFCMITVHNGLKISLQPMLMMLAVATPNLIQVRRKNYVPDTTKLAIRT